MTRCISRAVVSQPPPGAAGAMISIGLSVNPSTVQAACAETGTSGAETAATAGARTIATRTRSRVPNRGDRIVAPLATDFHRIAGRGPKIRAGTQLVLHHLVGPRTWFASMWRMQGVCLDPTDEVFTLDALVTMPPR